MMNKPNEEHMAVQAGLVISYFGNSVAVEVVNGQVVQCHLKRNQALPVVGDRVHWCLGTGGTGTILEILPRRSLLSRGELHGKVKPIASNIDVLVVVMAPPPVFSGYLVDRYFIAAELLSIQPILVINKKDLFDVAAEQKMLQELKFYQALGYTVLLASTYQADGLVTLSNVLRGKSAVLVGPSGVGKSSIIGSLSKESIRVSEVSEKGVGKHTTTATTLYHLPGDTILIDSPGVREFNLWSISKEEVMKSFKEIGLYQADCQFRDCMHLKEPNCAVQKAMKEGRISHTRYESYQTLLKQADIKKYP